MSVIPFVLRGENPTITSKPEDYSVDGNLTLIKDLDEKQLAEGKCNASYDLRVGNEYKDHRDKDKTEFSDEPNDPDNVIELQPGTAVIIETAEWVELPRTRFGHIVPKVSLLQKGVSNTSSKIDPGYKGNLIVTIFNLGKQRVIIEKGKPFCTLYMLEIREDVTPYSGQPKRIEGKKKKKNKGRRFLDIVSTYNAAITLLFGFIIVILTTLQVLQLFGVIGNTNKNPDSQQTKEQKDQLRPQRP
jgi:deoxycytidine triphosphate deaminase